MIYVMAEIGDTGRGGELDDPLVPNMPHKASGISCCVIRI
jgi:hypothetical protein